MLNRLRTLIETLNLRYNRLRFHLFFKKRPGAGEYCNSKFINVIKQPSGDSARRPNLVIIRCGTRHRLINDGSERSFDVALNLYAKPDPQYLADCEYVYVGGINKYKAALQFISDELTSKYDGFMLLDDDLEMTYSQLSRFLAFCARHDLSLAQPSLTPDSSSWHRHLFNTSEHGWRPVPLVEVMCPYFSTGALRTVISTFRLSDSTWGLDYIWPSILDTNPAVVDEFMIRHINPIGAGGFYRYMSSIGVSPVRELDRLKQSSFEKPGLRKARWENR